MGMEYNVDHFGSCLQCGFIVSKARILIPTSLLLLNLEGLKYDNLLQTPHLVWLSQSHLACDPNLPPQPYLSFSLESSQYIYFHFSKTLLFLCLLETQLMVCNPAARACGVFFNNEFENLCNLWKFDTAECDMKI